MPQSSKESVTSLFDGYIRTDRRPRLHAEPKFTYLNRSPTPAASAIRRLLESWFARYPARGRIDLRKRFRSRKDWNHSSAFFELLLRELFLALGCCVRVHPRRGGSRGRPDFHVQTPAAGAFYAEATVATGQSRENAARETWMNRVYDWLDQLESEWFCVGLELHGTPRTQPPPSKVKAYLSKKLAELDYEQVRRLVESEGQSALPRWCYMHEGLEIEFFPIPKSARELEDPRVRPLRMRMEDARCPDTRKRIRDAVSRKAKPHKRLHLPYVICVNALGPLVERESAVNALFGQEQMIMTHTGPGQVEWGMTRARDGAWIGKSGSKNTRVSAVLLAMNLSPWKVSRASVCLYHNPWARRPCPSVLDRLPRAVLQGDRLSFEPGESLGEVFGLPDLWPDPDAFQVRPLT